MHSQQISYVKDKNYYCSLTPSAGYDIINFILYKCKQNTIDELARFSNNVHSHMLHMTCIYSLSLKIDAPKIDTFSDNSRNFQNYKIFWIVLSKFSIFGQNHFQSNYRYRQRLTRQRLTHFLKILEIFKITKFFGEFC